jgi:SNF2 family DNA or RNA helicase
MELKKNAIIAYPEGIVKAVNAAVLWGKLLQICAGAVYTTEKQVIDLHARQRMALIDTLIEGAEGKVIILAPYIHVVDLIHDEISKKHKAATVYGKTPAADRAAIFRAFQDPRDPLRVINAHPRVLAHGLNLTQADTVIWYAPILSREIYEQANDRIMRIGQTRQPYVVHLSSGIEEDAAYDILERKGTMQDATLKVFQLRTSAAQPTDPTVKLDEELVAV